MIRFAACLFQPEKQPAKVIHPLWLVALAALGLAGCDLAGYEAKYQSALQSAAHRAVFDQTLYPTPTEIMDASRKGAGVSLRLPKVFDNNTKSLPATEVRAQLPTAQIPGLSYAMERQLDDDGGKWLPAYAYFAVIPKAEQKPEAVQAALAQAAAALGPGAAWSDVPLKTPEGNSVTLKRLRVEGQQPFPDLQKNPPVPVRADGRLDVYLVDAGDNTVVVGWRAPKAQAQKHNFETATEAAMGTINVTATASAPAGKAAPAPAAG